jgi:hypothetical protein
MKPFLEEFAKLSPEDKKGEKGEAILLEMATAAARKTNDVTGILNALRKPNNSEVSTEERREAYQDLREAGTDPEAIKAVKRKWSNVFGPTALDRAIAGNNQNTGDTRTAIPPSVLDYPTSDQSKKALTAELADLKMRQNLVGGSAEAKAKGALRIREIEQTLKNAPPKNKLIKTD